MNLGMIIVRIVIGLAIFTVLIICLESLSDFFKNRSIYNSLWRYKKVDSELNTCPFTFNYNEKTVNLIVKTTSFKSEIKTYCNRHAVTLYINNIPAFTAYELEHLFYKTIICDYNLEYDQKEFKNIMKAAKKAYDKNLNKTINDMNNSKSFV